MVLHLDLLNYGEAVDRLSKCLLLFVFPYIHFTQHGDAAVSARLIPRLQPARADECTLQSQITVTSGCCRSLHVSQAHSASYKTLLAATGFQNYYNIVSSHNSHYHKA